MATDSVSNLLQEMPNIGPAMAADLIRLGVRKPEDLVGRDGDEMWEDLARLDGGKHHDPCVRDVFAAAIGYAETGNSDPWWAFTPARKQRDAERCGAGTPKDVA